MSRIYICRNMGESGKLRFYERHHDESKMRLLNTHSHTSNGPAMEPGTREEKQLKENVDPTTKQKPPIKNLPRTAGVVGGRDRKGSRTCRIPPMWRGGQGRLNGKPTTEKLRWQDVNSKSQNRRKLYVLFFLHGWFSSCT